MMRDDNDNGIVIGGYVLCMYSLLFSTFSKMLNSPNLDLLTWIFYIAGCICFLVDSVETRLAERQAEKPAWIRMDDIPTLHMERIDEIPLEVKECWGALKARLLDKWAGVDPRLDDDDSPTPL